MIPTFLLIFALIQQVICLKPELPFIPSQRIPWISPAADGQQHPLIGEIQEGKRELIHVPEGAWIQVHFSEKITNIPKGSAIKIQSLEDGFEQILDSVSLKQWSFDSAYMNGDAVIISVEGPDNFSSEGFFKVEEVTYGQFLSTNPKSDSICTRLDRREISNDTRAARLMPIGCTSWLIDDKHHCFLTAGHCYDKRNMIVEFNVPRSMPDGTVRHPSPADQYPLDKLSIQHSKPVEKGHDWMYFGTHINSNTKLPAFKAQKNWYKLSKELKRTPSLNSTLEIIGYGVTRSPNQDKNQVQQVHRGPLSHIVEKQKQKWRSPKLWSLHYQVDTTGGNSGSAILNTETGEAVGIHAYAGCTQGRGSNSGMFIGHEKLQKALAWPRGVCWYGYRFE